MRGSMSCDRREGPATASTELLCIPVTTRSLKLTGQRGIERRRIGRITLPVGAREWIRSRTLEGMGPHDAHGDQIVETVVAYADDLIGPRVPPHEMSVRNEGIFALAVRSAECGTSRERRGGSGIACQEGKPRLGQRRSIGRCRRVGCCRRTRLILLLSACGRRLRARCGTRPRACDPRHPRRSRFAQNLLTEKRDADDPDIVGAAGPHRIRSRGRREAERRDLIVALAPARDLIALPRVKDIARLIPAGALTADHVDAVHGGDREHALPEAVAYGDRIMCAGLARDPVLAVAVMGLEPLTRIAIDELDIRETSGRRRLTRDPAAEEQDADRNDMFHGSPR